MRAKPFFCHYTLPQFNLTTEIECEITLIIYLHEFECLNRSVDIVVCFGEVWNNNKAVEKNATLHIEAESRISYGLTLMLYCISRKAKNRQHWFYQFKCSTSKQRLASFFQLHLFVCVCLLPTLKYMYCVLKLKINDNHTLQLIHLDRSINQLLLNENKWYS